MKNIPKIKSKWTDGKGTEFRVTKVESVDHKLWIHYINADTNNSYSCYMEAFTNRFTERLQ